MKNNTNDEIKELTDFLDKYGVKYRVVGDRVESDIVLLSHKAITQLPDSIGKLKCKYLSLINNKINSLPDSFGKLKCKYLYLDNNLTCKFMNVNASEWSKAKKGLSRYSEGTQFRHITYDCVTCSQYISDDGVKHYEFFNAKTLYKIDDFSSPQMQAVEKILYYILREDK